MINKAKTKEIWEGIKQLICLKSKGSTSPSKLIINEHEITNDKAIADHLNKFFSNTGKTWRQLYLNQIYHLIAIH